MTWLTPSLAAIVAAIAIPSLVILYFLKLRRKDVEISTTLLWKKSIQDLQANAPFQRLRRNILLFLQLLALAAILFGLAQPQRTDQEQAVGVKRVILLDRSASMQAIDGGRGGESLTRLEAAKRDAIELVEAMRQRSFLGFDFGLGGGEAVADETMLIVFDSDAEVRQQFTADKAALIRAIQAVEPSDAPSELNRAMLLARAHLPRQTYFDPRSGESIELEGRTLGNVAVHIFSDGRLPDASQVLTQAIEGTDRHPVEFVSVGATDAPNIGITAFSAERDYDNPQRLSVFIGLQSSARQARSVEISLLIDGVVDRVREVSVPGASAPEGVTAGGADAPAENIDWLPGTLGVTFPLERAEGGVFAVSLRHLGSPEPPDALAIDDRAWLIVPPARRMSVALVMARGNLYLQEAMLGLPLAALDLFTPDDFAAAVRDGRAAGYDVAVLDGVLPPIDAQGRMAPGRYLIYGGAPPPPAGVSLGANRVTRGAAQIIDWKRDHPVLRAVNLDSILIAELPEIGIGEASSAQVLVESDVGPAVLEIVTSDVRALVVPFDAQRSTWPLHLSWPVFNAAAVRYLGLDTGGAESGSRVLRPGSVLSDRLPPGAQDVTIISPDGTRSPLEPAPDGRIVFGPIRTSGTYSVTWSGATTGSDAVQGSRGVRTYAVSLLDPDESNVSARDRLELAAASVVATESGTTRAAQRLWPYLLLLAILIMLFEWWVYNRKVYL